MAKFDKHLKQLGDSQLFSHLTAQEALGEKIAELSETVETAIKNNLITKSEVEIKRKEFRAMAEENTELVNAIESELDLRFVKKLGAKNSTLLQFKKLYKYFIVDKIQPAYTEKAKKQEENQEKGRNIESSVRKIQH